MYFFGISLAPSNSPLPSDFNSGNGCSRSLNPGSKLNSLNMEEPQVMKKKLKEKLKVKNHNNKKIKAN